MNLYKQILVSAGLMLLLDFIWISANINAYTSQTVQIQRVMMDVKPLAAILCYIILIIGLNFFILSRRRPWTEAFLLGIVIYGVYNTTSLAIYKKYSWKIACMDTLWGGVLFATISAIMYQL